MPIVMTQSVAFHGPEAYRPYFSTCHFVASCRNSHCRHARVGAATLVSELPEISPFAPPNGCTQMLRTDILNGSQ